MKYRRRDGDLDIVLVENRAHAIGYQAELPSTATRPEQAQRRISFYRLDDTAAKTGDAHNRTVHFEHGPNVIRSSSAVV